MFSPDYYRLTARAAKQCGVMILGKALSCVGLFCKIDRLDWKLCDAYRETFSKLVSVRVRPYQAEVELHKVHTLPDRAVENKPEAGRVTGGSE